MAICQAAIMPRPLAPVELREVPIPKMEAGGVLLRTLASEICGTDVHLFHGRLAGVPYPLIPGHVSAGRIEEIGGETRDADGQLLSLGDTVVFYDVVRACGQCYACSVALTPTRCPHRKVYGITLPAERPQGGWATHIYLEPGTRMLKLPESLSVEDYMGGGCGLHTGFTAVELANIKIGSTVLVVGSGPVGLSAAAFARLSGAQKVMVTGAPETRLEAARQMEADATFDISETQPEDRSAWAREETEGRGPDIVIEAAGNPQAVVESLDLVREGGTVVISGQYTDAGDVSINPHQHINRKQIEVRGSFGFEFRHFYRATRAIATIGRHFPWRNLITRDYSLADAARGLEDVANLKVVKALIRP